MQGGVLERRSSFALFSLGPYKWVNRSFQPSYMKINSHGPKIIWMSSWIKWNLRFCGSNLCLGRSMSRHTCGSLTVRLPAPPDFRWISSFSSDHISNFKSERLWLSWPERTQWNQCLLLDNGLYALQRRAWSLSQVLEEFYISEEVSRGSPLQRNKLQGVRCPHLSSHVLHSTMKSFQREGGEMSKRNIQSSHCPLVFTRPHRRQTQSLARGDSIQSSDFKSNYRSSGGKHSPSFQ